MFKNRKPWFLLVHWVAKNSKANKKIQKQLPEVLCKKGVLKNFAKFTEKYLRCSYRSKVF